MSGAPAETWRKFSFSTAPPWAYLFGVIAVAIFSRRATGYLPLTRDCRKKLALALWVPLSLIPLAVLMWIGAAIAGLLDSGSIGSTIAWFLAVTGGVLLSTGAIGVAVVKAFLGPAGKVIERQPWQYDELVELRRVHPAFVIAVLQRQHARAAQYAYAPQAPFLPEAK